MNKNRKIDTRFEGYSMTDHHAMIRYFITYRKGTLKHMCDELNINWPLNRINEIEKMGVIIQRQQRVHRRSDGSSSSWTDYSCKTDINVLNYINDAYEKRDKIAIREICNGKIVSLPAL